MFLDFLSTKHKDLNEQLFPSTVSLFQDASEESSNEAQEEAAPSDENELDRIYKRRDELYEEYEEEE